MIKTVSIIIALSFMMFIVACDNSDSESGKELNEMSERLGDEVCEYLEKESDEELNEMSEYSKAIVDFLGCGYVLLRHETNRAEIFDKWQALYEQGKNEGFTPLVIVSSSIFGEEFKGNAWGWEKEDILVKAEKLFPTISEEMRIRAEGRIDESFLEFNETEVLEQMNEFVANGSLSWIERDNHTLGTYDIEELLIVKIPTENPWEVVAWVSAGGYYALNPAEQVALFKVWHERYGAVPALISHDTWQLYVPNPPQTDEEVLITLKEAYAFCYDSVETTGSFALEALLLKYSNIWGFWWD